MPSSFVPSAATSLPSTVPVTVIPPVTEIPALEVSKRLLLSYFNSIESPGVYLNPSCPSDTLFNESFAPLVLISKSPVPLSSM